MADTAPRVRDLLARGAVSLRHAEIDTPELDAAVLLAHLLGINRAALYARALDPVPVAVTDAYKALVDRRMRGAPVAYLTGTKEFMGLAFAVSPAVLVPRPETELLAGWAIAWLAARAGPTVAVDVGTGSGAVAVSIAKFSPNARVIASDISQEALTVARMNARKHAVAGDVRFVCGDLLRWLGRPVDLILANLPYLTDRQADAAELAAEPRNALAGGDADGFALYRALLPRAETRLTSGGAIAFEIDPLQATTAFALCQSIFPSARISMHRDLAGMARFVTVETAASADDGPSARNVLSSVS